MKVWERKRQIRGEEKDHLMRRRKKTPPLTKYINKKCPASADWLGALLQVKCFFWRRLWWEHRRISSFGDWTKPSLWQFSFTFFFFKETISAPVQLFLSFLFVCVPNRVFHNTNNAICTQGRKTRLPFLMHSFIMCAFWFRHGWLLKSSPLLSAGSIHFREHNGKPTRAAEVRASLPSPPLPPASLTTDLCLPPLPLSLHVSHLLFLSVF